MKKLGVAFSLAAVLAVAAGCGGGGSGDSGGSGGGEDTGGSGGSDAQQAAIVLDVGGLGDQSFNDSAFAGLQRANEEFSTGEEYLESGGETDYVNNLVQFSDNQFSPVFAVGFLMTDAVTQTAPQYPDTNYAIIDSVVEGQDNVASLVFREQEGSYLAGVTAGLMTQEDTDYTTSDEQVVGFLGGQESPLIQKFEAGYTAGVEASCPDCEVLVQYAGTTPEAFNDPARGSEIARQQNSDGADIIYHASGATGAGLFDVASEESFFAIGVDSDQAALVPDAPILTSVVKRVDNAVYNTIEQSNNGEFPGGEVVEFGLEDGGLSLAEFGEFDELVPQEVKDEIDAAEQGIIDGEIEVPDAPQ